jgi:transcriptional regulator with XRE-family HTH domain
MAERRTPKTARHRRLMSELNRYRSERGLSRAEVADRLGTTDTTIWRYETGLSRPKPADVLAMLEVYGVTGPARDELIQLAREARKRNWWHRHRQLLKPGFDSYIGLESEASVVRTYEPQTVPGLLQAESYARAVIAATTLSDASSDIDMKVSVRVARQSLLTRDQPIQLVAILDEAVLRRQVGGPETMRDQIWRLLEMARLPSVDIRVLPFGTGAHCAMDGNFSLLSFPEPGEPDLVYLEQATSGLILEDADDTRRYTLMFGNLLAQALSPLDTMSLLDSLADNDSRIESREWKGATS